MTQQVNTVFFTESRNTFAEDTAGRVSVAQYSAEEVIQHFLALYNCLDFKAEFEDIGIGPFQFMRRKKALRNFRALSVALWRLALQKSFPSDCADFFQTFLRTAPALTEVGKEAARLLELVKTYVELLEEKKDKDFLPVAAFLAKALALHSNDLPRLQLRLSLAVRNLYTLIFNKLV